MSTVNGPDPQESRLDRLERVVSALADIAQTALQLAQSNATTAQTALQLAEANARAIGRLTQRVDDLTAFSSDLREGQAMMMDIFQRTQDRQEQHTREMRTMQSQMLGLQAESRAMQSQVLGIQTENRRILERLERLDGGQP